MKLLDERNEVLKKLLLFMMVLFTMEVVGEEQGEKKMKSVLQDNPNFTIRMETEYANFIVTLNGTKVYNGIDGSAMVLEIPVNQLITSGDNELKVQLIAWDDMEYKLHKELLCKISLRVKKHGDMSVEPKTISSINYNSKKDNVLEASRAEGKYNSEKSFMLDKDGDVKIESINQKLLTLYQGDKIGGVMLSQTIKLKTPFPRWKFLDSENIIDGRYDELLNHEYDTLRERNDIKKLFITYKKIYDALEKKDLDFIIDLFDERNNEMDRAMYHNEESYYKNRLYEKLKENVNDSARELLKWNESKMYFFIEENSKLIYIDGAIAFNDKTGSTSTSYPILFRKAKDKWIISR